MEERDVAVADQGFRIAAGSVEIERVRDAMGAFAASGRDDCANAGIAQRVVQIGEAIIVFPREVVTVRVEDVVADFDLEAPTFEKLRPISDLIAIGRAGGRDESYTVSGL